MEIIDNYKPVARKEHYCDLCRLEIKIGERYRRSRVVECGEFWTWKEHLECNQCAKETLDVHEYEEVGTWAGAEWRQHLKEWKERQNDKKIFLLHKRPERR